MTPPQGTISITPDPPNRGDTTTITLSGGQAGTTTVTMTDGLGHSVDLQVYVGEGGTGSVDWTVPSNWGATLNIAATGYSDLNTAVG